MDDAQKALQRALALDPTLPLANNTMGLTALRKGMVGVAETHLREAIRLQPDLAEAHNNLGNLSPAATPTLKGLSLRKAIASNPRYVEARHSYGVTLALAGSYSRAVPSWKRWWSSHRDWQRCVLTSPTRWRRWGVWTRLARILPWRRRSTMRGSGRPRSPDCVLWSARVSSGSPVCPRSQGGHARGRWRRQQSSQTEQRRQRRTNGEDATLSGVTPRGAVEWRGTPRTQVASNCCPLVSVASLATRTPATAGSRPRALRRHRLLRSSSVCSVPPL